MPAAALVKPKEPTESDIVVAAHNAAVRKGTPPAPVKVIGEYRGKHVFVSDVGKYRENFRYSMDVKSPTWEEPDDDPQARRFARVALQRWNKRHTEEQKAQLAQAFEDNGYSVKIKFKYIGHGPRTARTPGHIEYETNSDAIAAVLNRAIANGELPFIRYIDQSRYLRVGDKAFAHNDTGWKLAREEAERTGSGIDIITKE